MLGLISIWTLIRVMEAEEMDSMSLMYRGARRDLTSWTRQSRGQQGPWWKLPAVVRVGAGCRDEGKGGVGHPWLLFLVALFAQNSQILTVNIS